MKQLYWMAAAVMPLMLASCGDSHQTAKGDPFKDVEYMPVKTASDGDWSMIGPDGKYLFEDGFDDEARLSSVVDGIFVVKENDKYSVYSAEKNPKVVGDLEGLSDVGAMGDGIIPVVRPQERISLYNKSGKLVTTLEPVNGKEIVKVYAQCINDRLPFCTEDDKWGCLDSKGKVAIPATFDGINSFGDSGYAVAYKNNDDSSQALVINKNGETVLKLKEDQSVHSIFDDKVMVTDNEDRVSIVPINGEAVKLPSKYVYVHDWNNDYIVVRSENGWGVVRNNSEFDVVIKPRYDDPLQILPDGKFLVDKDNDYIVLDGEGERVFAFEDAENAFYINSTWNVFVAEGKYQYFADVEGKRIGNEDFYNIYGSASLSDIIYSDYFNVDAFVSTIADQIEADAISGFKLGSNTVDYLAGEDPEDYLYSYGLDEDKVVEGYRFTVNSNFIGVNSLAQWEYNNNSYYDYSRRNYWTNTPVEAAKLIAIAQSPDLWKKVKSMIVKALEKKGFSVSNDAGDNVSMSNSQVELSISCSEGYGTTEISIYMTSYVVEASAPEPAPEEYL